MRSELPHTHTHIHTLNTHIHTHTHIIKYFNEYEFARLLKKNEMDEDKKL